MYVYVDIILHYIINPKVREQSPTPYIHLGYYYLRANSHQQHHWEHEAEPGHLPGEIKAPIAFLLLEKHSFGSSSEVPWHTTLVPPAPLPGAPTHKETLPRCPTHSPTGPGGDTWLQPTVLRNL